MDPSHEFRLLDPIQLNQLPQPTNFIPNQPINSQAFSLIKRYDHHTQKTNTSLHLISIHEPSDQKTLLPHLSISQAIWIDPLTILFIQETDQNHNHTPIQLWAINLKSSDQQHPSQDDTYLLGSLPTSISNLKLKQTSPESALLAFTAEVYPPYDHQALNHLQADQDRVKVIDDGSTGMAYDSLFVRHWDHCIDPHGKSSRIFISQLSCTNGRWSLKSDQPFRSPFPHLDGTDFDLNPVSIAVSAKDPNLNPAWHTRQNIYLVPIFPKHKEDARIQELTMGDQGATSNPVFSHQGGKLAWLEMFKDGYESDRNRVIVYDLASRLRSVWAADWDRSPSRLIWGSNDSQLFVLAQEHGHVKVFRVSSDAPPAALTHTDAVSELFYLSNSSSLLLNISSLKSPNWAHRLSLEDGRMVSLESPFNKLEASLDSGQSFWFDGAEGVSVHGLLIRPPHFSSDSKWPLLFLIHGGPQSAWNQAWSIRWNANAFAAAGYIVAMINPSGSTGFGQGFTDSIRESWGGKPYKDLVAGYEYLLSHFPEIDSTRTAALGASYGGYMVNWLMGHNESPLNFKAFVSHDGIYNTVSAWSGTDELYFPEHDLGGTPMRNRTMYEKWSPSNFVERWKTPCLVIHSRLDYRLPESEGLSVFNALQRHGVPSRFLYFPDESHWVTKPANSIRWYREIFNFLEKWCPSGPNS